MLYAIVGVGLNAMPMAAVQDALTNLMLGLGRLGRPFHEELSTKDRLRCIQRGYSTQEAAAKQQQLKQLSCSAPRSFVDVCIVEGIRALGGHGRQSWRCK